MFARLVQLVGDRPSAPRRREARPRLEALEERAVPTNTVVSNTTSFPFSGAGRVTAVWDMNRNGRADRGEGSSGSGALIGGTFVLTAAHMLYDTNPSTARSGWASWVEFAPGATGSYEPFGKVRHRRLTVPRSWTTGSSNSDIGVISLRQGFSGAGSFTYGNLNDSYLRSGTTVHMIHYPGKESGFDGNDKQWYSYGPIASRDSQLISYRKSDIRSVPGSSGAPLYVRNVTVNGKRYDRVVVGVHVRSSEGYYGTGTSVRINKTWFDFIGNAMRSNGSGVLAQGATGLFAPANSVAPTDADASPEPNSSRAVDPARDATLAIAVAAIGRRDEPFSLSWAVG